MQLQTPVSLPSCRINITPSSRILCLGSCFTTHIGQRLQIALPNVEVNPMGVLYNPASIQLAIELLHSKQINERLIFFGRDELFHSWAHSSVVSANTREECLNLIDKRLARVHLNNIDVLFITFGTSRIYRLADSGQVVANCHKEPSISFVEEELTIEEIVDEWKKVIDLLPLHTQIVFTISPYRYAKYGFHESQLSKARLLLAVDALCQYSSRCHYFPAYEIVLDELRDYRFYAPDMLHPTEQAADYIWERLKEWCFNSETLAFVHQRFKEHRRNLHRPIHQ